MVVVIGEIDEELKYLVPSGWCWLGWLWSLYGSASCWKKYITAVQTLIFDHFFSNSGSFPLLCVCSWRCILSSPCSGHFLPMFSPPSRIVITQELWAKTSSLMCCFSSHCLSKQQRSNEYSAVANWLDVMIKRTFRF